MAKMSTGEDSTLGNHRKYAVVVFGEDSKQVKFFDEKIAQSPNGADEEVIVPEGAVVAMLIQMGLSKEDSVSLEGAM